MILFRNAPLYSRLIFTYLSSIVTFKCRLEVGWGEPHLSLLLPPSPSKENLSFQNSACLQHSNVSFHGFRVTGGLHRSIEWYQEKKIKEAEPPYFACWTLHKPRNRATPEWLVSEDGPAQRHLDQNEAISKAHRLWLTPNRACTGSKALCT